MEKGLVLAIALIAGAFTYWRPLRRLRAALGLNLVTTGHAFLVLGYLMGLAFGDHRLPLTDDLSPVVALVAGWIGFATGMRFDLHVLRTVPRSAFVVALFPALLASVVVGGLGLLLFRFIGVGSVEAFAAAFVLAGAAATSGPTLAAMIRARRPGRSSEVRPVLRMIEFSAGFDDIVVVLLALVSFALFRPAIEPITPALLIGAAALGGALLGSVTWLFLGGRASEDERLLLGLGMLVFIAGFAGWLYLSPAAVAAVAAMVLINLPGERMARLLQAVRRVERPAVVILMTVIGFHASGTLTWIFFPLVFVLTVVRALCKHWGGALVANISTTPSLKTNRSWGNGLIPQGALGLMVTLSLFHLWRDDFSRTVLGAVAAASILNEIIAPWLFLRLLNGVTSATGATAARQPKETI